MSSEVLARLTRASETPARQTVVSTEDLRVLLARAEGAPQPHAATMTCRRCGQSTQVDFHYAVASAPVQAITP